MGIKVDEVRECARMTALVILVSPDLAHAYVDPTGGGFLLQLLLGGATGVVLLGRVVVRRFCEKITRWLRGERRRG
jgi:hypothetical protein